MQLKQTSPSRAPISLVSMIDVLMIMLVFFMVTSTYLNLRMIPLADRADEPSSVPVDVQADTGAAASLLVRLSADGRAHIRGRALETDALQRTVKERLQSNPSLQVVVLPSGQADIQALVSLTETLTLSGVRRLRILRLEASP